MRVPGPGSSSVKPPQSVRPTVSDWFWALSALLFAALAVVYLYVLRATATIAADGMEQEGEALAAQDAAEAVRARPAFVLRLEGQGLKRRGNVYLDERFFARMAADDDEELKQFLTPRYRPMLVEPRRWQGFDSVRASLRGCYYIPRPSSFDPIRN